MPVTCRPLRRPARVAAALVAVSLGGCGGHDGRASRVSLAIRSSDLADAPIAIDVRGLRAHERVTMHARWTAANGHPWTSSTPLRASAAGTIRLRGPEAGRALWAMRPVGPGFKNPYFAPPDGASSRAAVTLTVSGRTVARATLARRIAPASVHVRELSKRRDGVVGFLFAPRVATRRPAAVVFGGSEGGNSLRGVAAMLAAHGYPTLAVAYFGPPGLPARLVDIPLEYFARAVRLLRRAPHVDATRIAVPGTSRGGELALLLASTFPHLIHGAIGLVPSATVYPAPAAGLHAWTRHGRPVPFEDIPVERINGPVLTAGAGDDHVWASRGSVERIERRLTARHFRFPHEGLIYEHAGHFIGTALPYQPATPGASGGFGGTPRADAAAEVDLWAHILDFFAAR